MDLKDHVENELEGYRHILHPIDGEDVEVGFKISVRTKEKVLKEVSGNFTLSSILNKHVEAIAPQLLDENIHNRIFTPINTAIHTELIREDEEEG